MCIVNQGDGSDYDEAMLAEWDVTEYEKALDAEIALLRQWNQSKAVGTTSPNVAAAAE